MQAALDIALLKLHNQLTPEGFTFLSIAPSCVHTPESFQANGLDFDTMKGVIGSMPGSSGIFHPDDGARIILDTMDKFGPDQSGAVVGMWGTEDKWI